MLDDFQQTVAEMMSDFSTVGYYIKTVQGPYDPNTGTVITTTIEAPVRVILMDLTLQSNGYSVKYGTQVQAGDKEAYVEPTDQLRLMGINPATDKLRVGDTTYQVVTSKETNPTGVSAIVYYLYIRR